MSKILKIFWYDGELKNGEITIETDDNFAILRRKVSEISSIPLAKMEKIRFKTRDGVDLETKFKDNFFEGAGIICHEVLLVDPDDCDEKHDFGRHIKPELQVQVLEANLSHVRPVTAFMEAIENSIEAIRSVQRTKKIECVAFEGLIDISLDRENNRIEIRDNGKGMRDADLMNAVNYGRLKNRIIAGKGSLEKTWQTGDFGKYGIGLFSLLKLGPDAHVRIDSKKADMRERMASAELDYRAMRQCDSFEIERLANPLIDPAIFPTADDHGTRILIRRAHASFWDLCTEPLDPACAAAYNRVRSTHTLRPDLLRELAEKYTFYVSPMQPLREALMLGGAGIPGLLAGLRCSERGMDALPPIDVRVAGASLRDVPRNRVTARVQRLARRLQLPPQEAGDTVCSSRRRVGRRGGELHGASNRGATAGADGGDGAGEAQLERPSWYTTLRVQAGESAEVAVAHAQNCSKGCAGPASDFEAFGSDGSAVVILRHNIVFTFDPITADEAAVDGCDDDGLRGANGLRSEDSCTAIAPPPAGDDDDESGLVEAEQTPMMVFWQELYFPEDTSKLPVLKAVRERLRRVGKKIGLTPDVVDRVWGFVFLDMAVAPDSNKTVLARAGDLRMELFHWTNQEVLRRGRDREKDERKALRDGLLDKLRAWHLDYDQMDSFETHLEVKREGRTVISWRYLDKRHRHGQSITKIRYASRWETGGYVQDGDFVEVLDSVDRRFRLVGRIECIWTEMDDGFAPRLGSFSLVLPFEGVQRTFRTKDIVRKLGGNDWKDFLKEVQDRLPKTLTAYFQKNKVRSDSEVTNSTGVDRIPLNGGDEVNLISSEDAEQFQLSVDVLDLRGKVLEFTVRDRALVVLPKYLEVVLELYGEKSSSPLWSDKLKAFDERYASQFNTKVDRSPGPASGRLELCQFLRKQPAGTPMQLKLSLILNDSRLRVQRLRKDLEDHLKNINLKLKLVVAAAKPDRLKVCSAFMPLHMWFGLPVLGLSFTLIDSRDRSVPCDSVKPRDLTCRVNGAGGEAKWMVVHAKPATGSSSLVVSPFVLSDGWRLADSSAAGGAVGVAAKLEVRLKLKCQGEDLTLHGAVEAHLMSGIPHSICLADGGGDISSRRRLARGQVMDCVVRVEDEWGNPFRGLAGVVTAKLLVADAPLMRRGGAAPVVVVDGSAVKASTAEVEGSYGLCGAVSFTCTVVDARADGGGGAILAKPRIVHPLQAKELLTFEVEDLSLEFYDGVCASNNGGAVAAASDEPAKNGDGDGVGQLSMEVDDLEDGDVDKKGGGGLLVCLGERVWEAVIDYRIGDGRDAAKRLACAMLRLVNTDSGEPAAPALPAARPRQASIRVYPLLSWSSSAAANAAGKDIDSDDEVEEFQLDLSEGPAALGSRVSAHRSLRYVAEHQGRQAELRVRVVAGVAYKAILDLPAGLLALALRVGCEAEVQVSLLDRNGASANPCEYNAVAAEGGRARARAGAPAADHGVTVEVAGPEVRGCGRRHVLRVGVSGALPGGALEKWLASVSILFLPRVAITAAALANGDSSVSEVGNLAADVNVLRCRLDLEVSPGEADRLQLLQTINGDWNELGVPTKYRSGWKMDLAVRAVDCSGNSVSSASGRRVRVRFAGDGARAQKEVTLGAGGRAELTLPAWYTREKTGRLVAETLGGGDSAVLAGWAKRAEVALEVIPGSWPVRLRPRLPGQEGGEGGDGAGAEGEEFMVTMGDEAELAGLEAEVISHDGTVYPERCFRLTAVLVADDEDPHAAAAVAAAARREWDAVVRTNHDAAKRAALPAGGQRHGIYYAFPAMAVPAALGSYVLRIKGVMEPPEPCGLPSLPQVEVQVSRSWGEPRALSITSPSDLRVQAGEEPSEVRLAVTNRLGVPCLGAPATLGLTIRFRIAPSDDEVYDTAATAAAARIRVEWKTTVDPWVFALTVSEVRVTGSSRRAGPVQDLVHAVLLAELWPVESAGDDEGPNVKASEATMVSAGVPLQYSPAAWLRSRTQKQLREAEAAAARRGKLEGLRAKRKAALIQRDEADSAVSAALAGLAALGDAPSLKALAEATTQRDQLRVGPTFRPADLFFTAPSRREGEVLRMLLHRGADNQHPLVLGIVGEMCYVRDERTARALGAVGGNLLRAVVVQNERNLDQLYRDPRSCVFKISGGQTARYDSANAARPQVSIGSDGLIELPRPPSGAHYLVNLVCPDRPEDRVKVWWRVLHNALVFKNEKSMEDFKSQHGRRQTLVAPRDSEGREWRVERGDFTVAGESAPIQVLVRVLVDPTSTVAFQKAQQEVDRLEEQKQLWEAGQERLREARERQADAAGRADECFAALERAEAELKALDPGAASSPTAAAGSAAGPSETPATTAKRRLDGLDSTPASRGGGGGGGASERSLRQRK